MRHVNPAVRFMDESVIRDMTRVAEDLGAINLAQGFPELPLAEPVLRASHAALDAGRNVYTRTWGDADLRRDLALERHWGLAFDPETELVVTCGASEAIMASLLALLSPGDKAVVPEPIYENYLPGIRLAGARPAILPLDPFTGEWGPRHARVRSARRPGSRPQHPGQPQRKGLEPPGAGGPRGAGRSQRRHPDQRRDVQAALREALRLPDRFYDDVRATYARRCRLLSEGLTRAGWTVSGPQRTYFLLVDLRGLGIEDDREWAIRLARERGVAGVPGSAFLWDGMPRADGGKPDRRGRFLRLSFGKSDELIAQAVERLAAGPTA